MNELIDEIITFLHESNLETDLLEAKANNKAAAKRARISSLKLEKLFLEFRKRSVKEVTGKYHTKD